MERECHDNIIPDHCGAFARNVVKKVFRHIGGNIAPSADAANHHRKISIYCGLTEALVCRNL